MNPENTVDKLLAEQKAFEDRKKELIAELLRQKEACIRDFDEKLAKLGFDGVAKAKRAATKKPSAPTT